MATIFVGPGKVKFLVHQLIICRFSAFLRDAFAKATDTDSITLPDAEPRIFSPFVDWAYLATCFFPKLDCLIGPRFASFFDLVKLYVLAQTYDVQAVQDSIISTTYARLFDDREIWATLGSDTDLLEYLVCLAGTGARMYILITRALAYRMFPAATSQQKMSRLHGLAKIQANHRQICDSYGKGDSEEVDMSKILDAVPAALLRDILKEYFRMKCRGRSASMDFKAYVGTDSDFHLPRPAL
ncbi:hypothetical protein FJTKL_05133 [Diaporthe vaccinii]|uniref:BTB domain-containing protein n=1 Tax=Diaporthe vaccinii TaxID=105482 RepID=A0ABR4FEN1_9PEZI